MTEKMYADFIANVLPTAQGESKECHRCGNKFEE